MTLIEISNYNPTQKIYRLFALSFSHISGPFSVAFPLCRPLYIGLICKILNLRVTSHNLYTQTQLKVMNG